MSACMIMSGNYLVEHGRYSTDGDGPLFLSSQDPFTAHGPSMKASGPASPEWWNSEESSLL